MCRYFHNCYPVTVLLSQHHRTEQSTSKRSALPSLSCEISYLRSDIRQQILGINSSGIDIISGELVFPRPMEETRLSIHALLAVPGVGRGTSCDPQCNPGCTASAIATLTITHPFLLRGHKLYHRRDRPKLHHPIVVFRWHRRWHQNGVLTLPITRMKRRNA